MTAFAYRAVDAMGRETRGMLRRTPQRLPAKPRGKGLHPSGSALRPRAGQVAAKLWAPRRSPC